MLADLRGLRHACATRSEVNASNIIFCKTTTFGSQNFSSATPTSIVAPSFVNNQQTSAKTSVSTMRTEEELDEMRARFERARAFDDDDDWFVNKTPKASRDSTPVTTAIKKQKPAINSALKKWAVEAAKPPPMQPTKMKFEPRAVWEPRVQSEQAHKYAPKEISGYTGGGKGDLDVDGWRIDEYGRPVRGVERDVKTEREGLLEMIRARQSWADKCSSLVGVRRP